MFTKLAPGNKKWASSPAPTRRRLTKALMLFFVDCHKLFALVDENVNSIAQVFHLNFECSCRAISLVILDVRSASSKASKEAFFLQKFEKLLLPPYCSLPHK